MLKCHYCASANVRWFTPRSYADRAAVLLCMMCHRLTIMPLTKDSVPHITASVLHAA